MRFRIRWAKRGKLRYLSHHDEALVFERAARRGGLPLAYSKGFTAHPKIAFGSGLPVGYGSEVELLDIGLSESLPGSDIVHLFNEGLPEGLFVHAAAPVPDGAVSLGALIHAADYEVKCEEPWVQDAFDRFMGIDTYMLTKPYKGGEREDDLRAGVIQGAFTAEGIALRCAIKPRAIRPSDVFTAFEELMGRDARAVTFQRVALLTSKSGGFVTLDENYQELKVAS